MADDLDDTELRLLGRALANLRERKGMTQAEAGAAMATDDDTGMSSQGWGKYEAGQRPGLLRRATQSKMTAALGATAEHLAREFRRLAGESPFIPPGEPAFDVVPDRDMLLIRDRVQAGAWLAADDTVQIAPSRFPIAKDPRYRHADQWMATVVGDSMDRKGISDGDLVHCVSLEGSGHSPETGDIVEVERLRFGGGERELTLKEVEVTPRGLVLWPRSSNPRYQKPLDLRDGVQQDEAIEVRIRSFVVASIRRF